MSFRWRIGSSGWLQIEQASRGCVSGTAREWPELVVALSRLNVYVDSAVDASRLKDICATIVAIDALITDER